MDPALDESSRKNEKKSIVRRVREALQNLAPMTTESAAESLESDLRSFERIDEIHPISLPPICYPPLPGEDGRILPVPDPWYRDLGSTTDGQSVVTASTYHTALSRPGPRRKKVVPGQLRE
jgi:hypothetical protein